MDLASTILRNTLKAGKFSIFSCKLFLASPFSLLRTENFVLNSVERGNEKQIWLSLLNKKQNKQS